MSFKIKRNNVCHLICTSAHVYAQKSAIVVLKLVMLEQTEYKIKQTDHHRLQSSELQVSERSNTQRCLLIHIAKSYLLRTINK